MFVTRFLLSILAVAMALSAIPAQAQQVERIAAVVNDEPISLFDLEMRIRLALVSSNLPDGIESRQRVLPQVLRRLVDERLQMQEANRLGISVTDSELQDGIANVERQNRMQPGGLLQMLNSNGISAATIEDQIRAELAWVKIIRRTFARQVHIGDEEIDAQLDLFRDAQGKPEYLLAEIFLPVDRTQSDNEAVILGERLLSQLREGASFPALARQFSQSSSAAAGGDLGWVLTGGMGEELEQTLATLSPGELSPLVQTASGYYILLLRERRIVGQIDGDAVLNMAQLFLPLDGTAAPEAAEGLMNRAEEIASGLTSCAALQAKSQEMNLPRSGSIGRVKSGDLPLSIRDVVTTLPDNQPSKPVRLDDGIAVLMVCDRTTPQTAKLPTRDEIAGQLSEQRADSLARRLMRDLRREAFIDVRL